MNSPKSTAVSGEKLFLLLFLITRRNERLNRKRKRAKVHLVQPCTHSRLPVDHCFIVKCKQDRRQVYYSQERRKKKKGERGAKVRPELVSVNGLKKSDHHGRGDQGNPNRKKLRFQLGRINGSNQPKQQNHKLNFISPLANFCWTQKTFLWKNLKIIPKRVFGNISEINFNSFHLR